MIRARSISALFLFVALSVPALAQTTVRAKRLPAATLRQLAALPAPQVLPRENRHDDERKRTRTNVLGKRVVRSNAAWTRVAAETIAPPPVAVGFPSDTSHFLSPADASGGVSKSHVFAVSNAGYVVHSRSGAKVAQLSLSQFWRGTNTIAEFYDPRLLYDAAANRWLTVALRNGEALMLGVSVTGDPLGAWTRYEMFLEECDYTRLALTRDTVLVNTVKFTGGVIFSFTKSELYAAPAEPVARQVQVGSLAAVVHAPESTVEYFVEVAPGQLQVNRLDRLGDVHVVEAGFTWSDGDGQYAPQPGARDVEMGYGDIEAAEYRAGWLYAIHRIGRSTRTTDDNALLWWKVDPDGVRATETGLIDDKDIYYAYPSLAVNRRGDMLIAFNTFSETTYPSAAYVYRDAKGRTSRVAKLKDGDSSTRITERWGDYTTVVLDPLNDRDFWTGQIYSATTHWATWWAQVKAPGATKRRSVRR
jgi:hypothetical protein